MSLLSDLTYAVRKGLLFEYDGKSYEVADRNIRIQLIDIIITEEKNRGINLEKLADLILYEDLTDAHPDKMTREEYPILSEVQLARRQEGKHVKRKGKDGKIKPNKTEIPLKAAYDIGVDGKDYRVPRRRRLSTDEALIMDTKKAKNVERKRKYSEFIKPGKVEVWYLGN